MEQIDEGESSNQKTCSKTTEANSRSSISQFEDQTLDSVKEGTSCSLNLLPSHRLSFQNSLSGAHRLNITNSDLFHDSSSNLFFNQNTLPFNHNSSNGIPHQQLNDTRFEINKSERSRNNSSLRSNNNSSLKHFNINMNSSKKHIDNHATNRTQPNNHLKAIHMNKTHF